MTIWANETSKILSELQDKYVFHLKFNHNSKRVTLYVVTIIFNWRDQVQIVTKSSTKRILLSRKCTYSQSFSHIPSAHCYTSTLPTCCTQRSLHMFLFLHVQHTSSCMQHFQSRTLPRSPTLTETSTHVINRLTQRATPTILYQSPSAHYNN